MNIAKKNHVSVKLLFDDDGDNVSHIFMDGKLIKWRNVKDKDVLRLFLPFLLFVTCAEVDDLIDSLEEKNVACDMTLREFLAQAGVSERGMAYADAVYAQTSALSLDEMGVTAMQREVALCP